MELRSKVIRQMVTKIQWGMATEWGVSEEIFEGTVSEIIDHLISLPDTKDLFELSNFGINANKERIVEMLNDEDFLNVIRNCYTK